MSTADIRNAAFDRTLVKVACERFDAVPGELNSAEGRYSNNDIRVVAKFTGAPVEWFGIFVFDAFITEIEDIR